MNGEPSELEPDAKPARQESSREKEEGHREDAERRTSPSASVVHGAVRREGEDELSRPSSALAWSGVAAGLSMGFSFVAEALLQSALPDAPWRPLVTKFGYSLGFLFVILGRQQLFTENTLTPILPLLHRTHSVFAVARLWGVVLAANMVGTALFGFFVARAPIFDPAVHEALHEVGMHIVGRGFAAGFCGAILAGWLIALMVWLLPFAESARVFVIVLVTYMVGIGGFSHIVAGSADAAYLLFTGSAGAWDLFTRFWLPTLLGNAVGGVLLVAALNHAQVISGGGKDV